MRESLARLEVAWRFLAAVFHEPPTAAFLNALAADDLMARWPLGRGAKETQTGLELLAAFCADWNESRLPALEDEFYRLFVGPGLPPAPPWESYYLNPDRLLFQQETLAVRQVYREFGLEVPQRGSEPDDSLALEFFFLGELCGRGAAAAEDEWPVVRAIRRFLDFHTLRWAPQCLGLVMEHARLDYYRAAALLASGCLVETSAMPRRRE